MFGEEFGLDYHQQRHKKLVEEIEHERLVRELEARRRAERNTAERSGLRTWVLAAAGSQLERLGRRLQQAALAPR